MGKRIPIVRQAKLCTRHAGLFALVALFAIFASAQRLAAQEPQALNPPVHKTVHHPAHHAVAQSKNQPAPAAESFAPVAPPAPAAPDWPVNDHAAPASVIWDSHGLRIDAANSSLADILHDVSTATGVKVEGLADDERVFGTYGPGEARDVISQLLQGSAYNVLMVGDQGLGAPREIVLSVRRPGDAQPAPKSTQQADDDADVEEPAQPQQPMQPPMRAPFGPGGQPNPHQVIYDNIHQQQQQSQPAPNQPN